MSGRREQLQARDLANPSTSAQGINDVLKDLYLRVEALERSEFVDLEVTSAASAALPAITIAAPRWPVRAVYIAKLFDVTNSSPVYLTESLMWTQVNKTISIPAIYMPAINTRYAITFELRG